MVLVGGAELLGALGSGLSSMMQERAAVRDQWRVREIAALCARRLAESPSIPFPIKQRIQEALAQRDVYEQHPSVRRVLEADETFPQGASAAPHSA